MAGRRRWFRDSQHHLSVARVICPTWHVICVSFRARAALHGCPTDRRCRPTGHVKFKTPRGNTMKKMQGFTLIELMIVVAIIAILAAIAISQYQDYVIRSQVSEGGSLGDGVKTALAEFYNNKGYFPPSNQSAGLAIPASIIGNYVSQVDAGTAAPGQIQITYSSTAPQEANAKIDGTI